MERRIKTVLIASGGGTDANAIMESYKAGFVPNIKLVKLISTKAGEGCLDKAKKNGVESMLLDSKIFGGVDGFNEALNGYIDQAGIELVFLVGCIIKIYPITGVAMYNIHPADPHDFGGNGMYGLKVHEGVLKKVKDLIVRGKKGLGNRFFTYPTVHEAVLNYDSGKPLLRACVEIPKMIIEDYFKGETTVTEAAKYLQKHVLPYEWMILPTAVTMAAQKILDEEKNE